MASGEVVAPVKVEEDRLMVVEVEQEEQKEVRNWKWQNMRWPWRICRLSTAQCGELFVWSGGRIYRASCSCWYLYRLLTY